MLNRHNIRTNMKVNTRLIMSFGVIVAMVAACTLLAGYNITKVGKQLDKYAAETLPNVISMMTLKELSVEVEQGLLLAMMESNKTDIDSALVVSNTAFKGLGTEIEKLKELQNVDLVILQTIDTTYNALIPVQDRITTLMWSDEWEAAFSVYENEYTPYFDKLREGLIDLRDVELGLAKEHSEIAHNVMDNSYISLTIVTILAIVFSLFALRRLRKDIILPL